MKRRSFLRGASLLPLPIVLGQARLSALTQPFLSAAMNQNDDRVLVLIQLDGGNDGLNTVLPLDQYSSLMAVRENLVIPENQVLKVEDNVGFHPAFEGIRSMYDEGQVAVVQGVGYPQQNRSHFRSTDIWNTASASNEVITTGWLGRHLDSRYPNFPADYPNQDEPAPFAVVMGNSVSETCQGRAGNFSIAISNIDNVGQLPSFDGGVDLNTPYGRELDWLRTTISQSNEYATTISAAVEVGNTMADYPEDNQLAERLRDVARLISGGLQTKIYVVRIGGFDTHANQTLAGDPTVGEHADLLRELSDAVAAFQQDLKALNLEERVVGMTHSEFGRRIRSNASQGTDHGDAAPLFLFGSCVAAGITGDNAEIDPEVGNGEAVPMQYDFRNVYGSLLVDWFGVPENDVEEMLIDDFTYIPVISACSTTTSTNDRLVRQVELGVQPNPFQGRFEVTFVTGNERVRLSLFNATGQEIRTVMDRELPAGEHRVPINTEGLPNGPYFVHLMLAGGIRKTKRVVKQ